jgi:hypothetical protein
VAGGGGDVRPGDRRRTGHEGPDGDRFHADIAGVVRTHVKKQATKLVVERSTPGRGYEGSTATDQSATTSACHPRSATDRETNGSCRSARWMQIAESVAPPGAIPDGATADTGAM